MSKLSPLQIGDRSFSLDQAPGVAVNPSPNLNQTLGWYLMAQSDPEFRSQSRHSGRSNGLRHCFIKDSADNASVYDAAESLGESLWNPFRGRCTVIASFKSQAQTAGVVAATCKT